VNDLELTIERSPAVITIHAAGAVDANTAASLQEPLLDAAADPAAAVRVDLAAVSYMSSAGLRVLLMAAKALRTRGQRLQLARVPPLIHNVLSVAGFTSFLDLVE
jgi:anti-anti-sigma factor